MEKIYGYKEKDVIGLAKYLSERKNKSLTEMFESYGLMIGKAKGTVRNMYYALARYCNEHPEFCAEYLGGKPINVGKIVEFDKTEERELVKKILLAKKEGKSARSIITELAGGDMKTALRYQNKFRNAVRNNTRLVAEIISEIRSDDVNNQPAAADMRDVERTGRIIPDAQFKKLRNEIDNLVGRISLKLRRENAYLKDRINSLELENMRLNNMLFGGSGAVSVMHRIKAGKDKKLVN